SLAAVFDFLKEAPNSWIGVQAPERWAVQQEEVHVIRLQSPETAFQSRVAVGRREVLCPIGIDKPGLGRDDDLRAHLRQRPAEQLLTVAAAVQVRGIVESNAQLEGPAQGTD